MRYKLHSPDPIESARCLRSLDDGRSAFRPGRAAPRKWDASAWAYEPEAGSNFTSIVRAQLTSQALPIYWRHRDRATQAIWPPESDIVTWAGIGAMHALAPLYPRPTFPIFKTDDQRPHALAYLAAYAAVIGAYMTPQDVSTQLHIPPDGIPPALAAAWVQAAKKAPLLLRDATNESTGHYTSADGVADQARKTLADQDLLWTIVGDSISAPTLSTSDIGSRAYVGDVSLHWMLVHGSGAVLRGTSMAAVVAMKATPHDKAVQAAKTFLSGNVLRGLLCFVREDKHSTDERLDREEKQGSEFEYCKPETAKAIGKLCTMISALADCTREQVLRGAFKQAGLGDNVAALDNPGKLSPEAAVKVHEWLENDYRSSYPADDDQRQPGEDRDAP